MWKQMTMYGFKSLWIILHIETTNLKDIPFVSRSFGITKRDLFVEGILVQEFHRLQVRVELFHYSELLSQQVLDNVSHCHIIRQSDSIADGDELSTTSLYATEISQLFAYYLRNHLSFPGDRLSATNIVDICIHLTRKYLRFSFRHV